MFLTCAELEEMTGYKNHAAQAAWLAENGYRFDLNKNGRPNVMVDQVRERQLAKSGKPGRRTPGPDFSALEKAG